MYEMIDPNKKADDVVDKIKTDEFGRLKVGSKRSVRIDHAGAANMVIKHINTVPNLSVEGRLIMSMKVMNPGLKNKIIAREMRLTEYDVAMYEKEAVLKCADHIKKMNLQDSVEKFNLDGTNEQSIKNLNRDRNNPMVTGISENT